MKIRVLWKMSHKKRYPTENGQWNYTEFHWNFSENFTEIQS